MTPLWGHVTGLSRTLVEWISGQEINLGKQSFQLGHSKWGAFRGFMATFKPEVPHYEPIYRIDLLAHFQTRGYLKLIGFRNEQLSVNRRDSRDR